MKKNQYTNKDWSVVPFDQLSRVQKRKRLFNEANHECPSCGFNKRRESGHHILEIDHIDGNHLNENRDNLRVLCPNCHALTPNFRNWGRSQKRSSTRCRKGNKEYVEVQRQLREKEAAYISMFKQVVNETFESGEIDYSKFGWVQLLANKLMVNHQWVGKRLPRLMPEFYIGNCFMRGKKKL